MDSLGVREGAVESPHAFNMYINDLRSYLDSKHPRPFHLLGVMISVVLYADDAAIPADSLEDLQLAASLFEEYCNDNRLFISTPKTFFTVFHCATDTGVQYSGEEVIVDGSIAEIQIYSNKIAATPDFKYLGVHLDSTGCISTHFTNKLAALDRTAHLLASGLS